jgi:hypothetical protein
VAAVTQNGMALRSAYGDLKKDHEVVKAALRQNGRALEFAHEDVFTRWRSLASSPTWSVLPSTSLASFFAVVASRPFNHTAWSKISVGSNEDDGQRFVNIFVTVQQTVFPLCPVGHVQACRCYCPD